VEKRKAIVYLLGLCISDKEKGSGEIQAQSKSMKPCGPWSVLHGPHGHSMEASHTTLISTIGLILHGFN
jgi:hypothetical protein